MIQKSRAIVLHHLKYSETSVIATLYTEAFGRQSFMINGIRSSKSKMKMGLLQPLFLLEIEAYHRQGRDIQRLKEFKMSGIYQSIPFEIVKSTMAMFISELLNKVLRNEEQDSPLFNFIYDSLQYFDSIEKGAANFHLWFLVKLLGYLGFRLENNQTDTNLWFDLKAGCFVADRPSLPKTPDIEESALLSQLIQAKAGDLNQFSINGEKRARMLEVLIEYYTIHFDGIGTIKSLQVLREIYH